jgi:hypothetical protein
VEIHYCAECSCRIQEGDERFVEGIAYCSACHLKKFPRASRTGIKPAGRRSTPAKALARISTAHQTKPVTGAILKSGTHRAPTVRVQRQASASTGAFAVIGGVCAVIVLVGLIYVLSSSPGGEKERRTTTGASSDGSRTASSKSDGSTDSSATPVTTPAQKTQLDPMQEMREGLARKSYDALLRDERDGRLAGNRLHKALTDFVGNYGSTAAGREAASKLERLPPPSPDPTAKTPTQAGTTAETPPAGALYANTFESDADRKDITIGERSEKGGFNAPGFSVVSAPDKRSTYLTSRIDLKLLDRAGVPVHPDSWVRFAVFLEEGDNQICCHSLIGDFVYEKYVKGLPRKQWTWVTFRIAGYDKNLKTGKADKPVAGARFYMTAIFGCGGGGKPTRLHVDDFSIGNGPLP